MRNTHTLAVAPPHPSPSPRRVVVNKLPLTVLTRTKRCSETKQKEDAMRKAGAVPPIDPGEYNSGRVGLGRCRSFTCFIPPTPKHTTFIHKHIGLVVTRKRTYIDIFTYIPCISAQYTDCVDTIMMCPYVTRLPHQYNFFLERSRRVVMLRYVKS